MRVALVHDWLTGMRGGEKVLLSLARLFPEAPIYTLLHVPGSVAPELEARTIRTSFVQRLPGVRGHYRRYLPLFPAATAGLDVSSYDLVLSSSHCAVKAVRRGPRAVHVCYCHTPMRYVWDRYPDYFGPGRASPVTRLAAALVTPWLRRWDARTATRVDHFVANSRYVAGRIQRYYGREAEVVPPPVDTEFFTPARDVPGTYDLVVSALAPYKRLDVVLAAYAGTGWPVKIVGWGPEERRLRAAAPPEASFAGKVDDHELRELYRGCRAVLMPGVEDFGIVPLEAMACGRPAVVFAEGGGPESVVPGQTGVIFDEATPSALRAAVDSLGRLRFNVATLRRRAEEFSRGSFESRLEAVIEQALRASPANTPTTWSDSRPAC